MGIYVILRGCLRLKHGATKLKKQSIQGYSSAELLPSADVEYDG